MKRTVITLALMGVVSWMAQPAVGQGEPDYWVYLSNADTLYRFDPATCVEDVACIQTLLAVPGAELRGLNFGPDENLYWCDSENGRVGRVNPSTLAEEVFFTFSGSGPAQPQCGWFNHLGDFAVTDRAGGGVWSFGALADYDGTGFGFYSAAPTEILTTGAEGLEGVTQYIDGDLLVVVPGGKKKGQGGGAKGSILSSDFDFFLFGSPPPYPFETLVEDLSSPQGVAVAEGYLFVTEDKKLQRFDSQGAFKEACGDFGRNTPLLLSATVDGQLFIGTESNRDGRIYRVDFDGVSCGDPVLMQTLPKNLGYAPAVTGVAVSQNGTTVTETVGADPTPEGNYEAAFTFNGSNVWELTAGPSCTASITGYLTAPGRVQDAIDAIVVNDPNDPDANVVLGGAVNFFGDNGNAYVWRLCGEITDPETNPCPDLSTTCAAGDGGYYRHLITGYAPPLFNGRIGVCDPTALPEPTGCGLMELTISVSFDPALAKVDPLGGRRGSGSDYYLLDVSTENARVPGFFCGFESPLSDTDPPAQFSTGGTIPVKFRLARTTDEFGDPITPNCQNGPFITEEAVALLSVAQLEPFEVKKRIFANGAGEDEPAYFQGPLNPSQSFHYNLDTTGYAPGLHLLEVSFPYDNETVKQVLIEMVP